jgi:equilibrative nucleoside transporter 1/2/3
MFSTLPTLNMGANLYFIFTLAMVVITAVANGLSQNAAFAFAAGFGRTEYAPAIMTGEALAGLLPSTIGMQIFTPNSFPL